MAAEPTHRHWFARSRVDSRRIETTRLTVVGADLDHQRRRQRTAAAGPDRTRSLRAVRRWLATRGSANPNCAAGETRTLQSCRWRPGTFRPRRPPSSIWTSTHSSRQDDAQTALGLDAGHLPAAGSTCISPKAAPAAPALPGRAGASRTPDLVPAMDDNQPSQRRRQTAESTRRCRSQCESGTGLWIGASSETVAASGKQQPGVSAAGRSFRHSRRSPPQRRAGGTDQIAPGTR